MTRPFRDINGLDEVYRYNRSRQGLGEDETCPICDRWDVLLVPYRDGYACDHCVAAENGEDDGRGADRGE